MAEYLYLNTAVQCQFEFLFYFIICNVYSTWNGIMMLTVSPTILMRVWRRFLGSHIFGRSVQIENRKHKVLSWKRAKQTKMDEVREVQGFLQNKGLTIWCHTVICVKFCLFIVLSLLQHTNEQDRYIGYLTAWIHIYSRIISLMVMGWAIVEGPLGPAMLKARTRNCSLSPVVRPLTIREVRSVRPSMAGIHSSAGSTTHMVHSKAKVTMDQTLKVRIEVQLSLYVMLW